MCRPSLKTGKSDFQFGQWISPHTKFVFVSLIWASLFFSRAPIFADPTTTDSDFDGYTDYDEGVAGTDPNDSSSYPGSSPDPWSIDSDGDGYSDGEESAGGYDPNIRGSSPDTSTRSIATVTVTVITTKAFPVQTPRIPLPIPDRRLIRGRLTVIMMVIPMVSKPLREPTRTIRAAIPVLIIPQQMIQTATVGTTPMRPPTAAIP